MRLENVLFVSYQLFMVIAAERTSERTVLFILFKVDVDSGADMISVEMKGEWCESGRSIGLPEWRIAGCEYGCLR